MWCGLFCDSCGITCHRLLNKKYNKGLTRNSTKVLFTALKYKKSSHGDIKGKSAFQTIAIELYKQPKETNWNYFSRLVISSISSIRVGVVAKTDDEVSSTIKMYRYFSFVFSTVPKKVQLLKYRKWCSYFENHYHHEKILEKNRINFSVSPYCTLLFSRKENIKFSEVVLVTVHWNCLISCLKIA